ncbi:MAG TPA: zinc ABC transporter substrate-binding protein [Pseudonocardiaceae bacterium]
MRTRSSRLFAAAGLAAALAAGCSTDGGSEDAPGEGTVTVVASTNVWGSVAAAVGGDQVSVTSIVAAGDPHSYQVSARDAATLRDADLIVANGGGYDDFIAQALGGDGELPLVEAFAIHERIGHDEDPAAGGDPSAEPSGEPSADPSTEPSAEASGEPVEEPSGDGHEHGENEHVWYDLHTVGAVADDLAVRLGDLRPEAKDTFTANAAAFRAKLEDLESRVTDLAAAHDGTEVAATEPVAHHLLAEAGLHDVTPPEFVEAVEEGNDPPAAVVAQLGQVVEGAGVAALVHNPQTETAVVSQLVGQAEQAGVPVVEMTETLPDGQDYLTWMAEQITALAQALDR